MSVMQRVRKMLDERGAKYHIYKGQYSGSMEPYEKVFIHDEADRSIAALTECAGSAELTVFLEARVTPEQAVQAVLGPEAISCADCKLLDTMRCPIKRALVYDGVEKSACVAPGGCCAWGERREEREMSIDYTPRTMIGWQIDDDDDPRLIKLVNDDCWELDDLAHDIAKRLGFDCLGGLDLTTERNRVCGGEGWVVGIPIGIRDVMSMSQANKDEIEPCAIEVWRAVYGSEPPSKPELIDFVQVW